MSWCWHCWHNVKPFADRVGTMWTVIVSHGPKFSVRDAFYLYECCKCGKHKKERAVYEY